MANNSAIVNSNQLQLQQQQQQGSGHFQQPNSAHHCKECGLFFDSAKSLEVHLQYHKENLLNKWANQAAGQDQETNNNNSGGGSSAATKIKREYPSTAAGGGTIAAAADSSDSMLVKSSNKSPDSYNSRATPETSTASFGHPPTPQSYHSAPSPYQSHGEPQGTYSPTGYQPQQYQAVVKSERASPHYTAAASSYHLMYDQQQQQYFGIEQQLGYPQDYPVHKMPGAGPQQSTASFRYHPYGYERSAQVSSSSPAYPSGGAQPTPSPSPKQCDKCGCVCDSAAQLVDHLNHAHPPPSAQFRADAAPEEPQTEILDLDSHKVHHVFQSPEEEDELKRNGGNPHSVSAMLGSQSWPGPTGPQPGGIFGLPAPDQKQHQQMFQMHPSDYIVQPGAPGQDMLQYRPFEHLPPQPTPPVISSTQLASAAGNGGGGQAPPSGNGKGANWKSNEARRPKTYNCSACNKWFTSSGHLKRHYNTTLHKNAVKSSGQPDPATMPISAHHHPGRDERSSSRGSGGSGMLQSGGPDSSNHSPDSADNGQDDSGLSPAGAYDRSGGLQLQQPPSGPYDRQPPGLGPLHSPSGATLSNLSSGSPPNGEAGPSASHQDHLSRGLLSISTLSSGTNNQRPLSPMASQMHTNNQPQQAFSLFPGAMMGPGSTPLHSPQPQLADTSSSMHLQQQQQQQQQAFHQHHHQQQQQQMHSMQPNYPNGSAPHVTPAMATTTSNQPPASTSLTITGEQYGELYGLPMYEQHQPLPSFAQFQSAHHRYGILLAPQYHQANVGGAGPATDSLFNQQQQHMINVAAAAVSPPNSYSSPAYRHLTAGHPTDEDYEITVLEAAAHDMPYSPPHHNNNLDMHLELQQQQHVEVKLADSPPPPQLPPPPIKVEPKHDYEHGSPQITSTGSPMAVSKSHVGPNGQHKCFDCDKMFNKACYLTQHNKTFHCGDKPFKCHRCGKRFPSDPSYQEHLAKHAGDKPYKCELCPKQFNHKTDLRRHMCLHTGQKPYACEHCGKGFIRKDHMLKHAETHSRKTHHKASVAAAAAAAAAN